MAAEQPYGRRNRDGLVRLRALVAELGERELGRPLANAWTVSAALAHMAFWDRYALASLEQWERTGLPPRTGEADAINAAGLSLWSAVPPLTAAQAAVDAAEAVDQHIETLPGPLVASIVAAGRERLLDRSLHRLAHLAELERSAGVPLSKETAPLNHE